MKRLLALMSVLMIMLQAKAQNQDMESINTSANNSSQNLTLNDSRPLNPIFFYFPDYFSIGKITSKTDFSFFENNPAKSRFPKFNEYMQIELFNEICTALLSYIPRDSSMTMRFIDMNNLLFEINFYWENDTIVISQDLPGIKNSKTFKWYNNKTIFTSYNNKDGKSYFSNRLYGDSLRVLKWDIVTNGFRELKRFEFRFTDGKIQQTLYFKNERNSPFKLYSIQDYFYNEQSQVIKKEVKNAKGKLRNTIIYNYKDNLLASYKKEGKGVDVQAVFKYDDEGRIKSKTYHGEMKKYSTTIVSRETNKLEIDFYAKGNSELIIKSTAKWDSENRFAELETREQYVGSKITGNIKRYIYSYNELNNVSGIKVFSTAGLIERNITIEYAFFKP